MTPEPDDILSYMRELRARWETFEEHGLPEDDLVELEGATCNLFPAMVQALEIAYEALGDIDLRGEHMLDAETASVATSRIRSIPLPS